MRNYTSIVVRFLPILVLCTFATTARAQVSTQPHVVMARNSGMCLNVNGETQDAGAGVIQWICDQADNSMWTLEPIGPYYHIVVSHSGQCLNVSGASTDNEAPIIQWPCQPANQTNDQWIVEPSATHGWQIRNVMSNLCVNIDAASGAKGAAVIQWDCDGSDNESFTFGQGFVPNNFAARLVSSSSSFCADSNSLTATGSKIVQTTCRDNSVAAVTSQLWYLKQSPLGIQVVNQNSNLCLGIKAGTNANATMLQSTCAVDANQVWQVASVTGGFTLANAASNLCLTAPTGQGGSLTQKACVAGTAAQIWRVSAERRQGSWSNLVELPIVPVAAAALNNRKVMFWSAYDAYTFGGDNQHTLTALVDPNTDAIEVNDVTNTQHDMFCPGTALLADGSLLVNGGSSDSKTSIYNVASDTWSAAGQMNIGRGYESTVTMSNGNVFTIGGSWDGPLGGKNAEVFSPNTKAWTLLGGALVDPMVGPDPAGVYRGDNHGWLFSMANGQVFQAGPSAAMNMYTAAGNGNYIPQGNRADDQYSINGTATMFDIGKILKLGGAPAYQDTNAVTASYVISVGSAVTVAPTGSLAYPRAFVSSVVYPDGRVAAFGGQDYPVPFTDNGAQLTPELWDQTKNSFAPLASMSVPRTYHSVALLLPDARILCGGGGLCGDDCDQNHPDFQLYSPDYLFQPNGLPAVRPTISSAPATVGYNASMKVKTNRAVTAFSLVRMGSVTHTVNTDQRRVPLTITATSSTTYTLTSPANSGVAPPGYYMLFALDASGVPSVANIVQVK